MSSSHAKNLVTFEIRTHTHISKRFRENSDKIPFNRYNQHSERLLSSTKSLMLKALGPCSKL